MPRTFQGAYRHSYSGELVHYVGHYQFTAVGVVYEAEANLGSGPYARLVRGVIVWGIAALPPKRRVELAVRDTIDILDINWLKEALAKRLEQQQLKPVDE